MLGKLVYDTTMTQAEQLHDEHCGSTVNGTDDREAFPKRWVSAPVQVVTQKS